MSVWVDVPNAGDAGGQVGGVRFVEGYVLGTEGGGGTGEVCVFGFGNVEGVGVRREGLECFGAYRNDVVFLLIGLREKLACVAGVDFILLLASSF